MVREARYRWHLRRQAFFIKQRLFLLASALLLDNATCGRMRVMLLRANGARAGKNCIVRGGLLIQEGFRLTLGNRVFINADCCIDCSAPVYIGDRVQLAYQVTVVTGGHDIGPPDNRAGPHAPRPVSIGPGAWIGARAIILPGVTIGAGAVVAAGSIVTRNVDQDTLVAGTPARMVRPLGGRSS